MQLVTKYVRAGTIYSVKAAFHDTDIDTDTDILARILVRMSVSISLSWNAARKRVGTDEKGIDHRVKVAFNHYITRFVTNDLCGGRRTLTHRIVELRQFSRGVVD